MIALLGLALAAPIDRVAATVGDEVIAMSEVYDIGTEYIEQSCPLSRDACVRDKELEVLDSIILNVLMRQELADLGIDITSAELDQTMTQIASDNGFATLDELRAEIERNGESWSAYRQEIQKQLRDYRFRGWVIAPRVPVTEDEMRDLYRRTARDMSGPPRTKFDAIVMVVPEEGGTEGLADTVMAAHDLKARLAAEDLTWEAAVAEFHSGRLSGADSTGLPAMKEGDLDEPLNTAVFATEVDAIADPVTLNGMVFLVRPTERIEPEVLPYEELTDRLREAVAEQKTEMEIFEWYEQARRRAAVRVLLQPWRRSS